MHLESPAFKRCCFCMPLRRGLIGWAYVRLAMGTLTLISLIFFCTRLFSERVLEAKYIILVITIYSTCLLDLAFNLILICGGHKKSAKLLSISFILGVIWLIPFLTYGLYLIYFDTSLMIRYWDYDHYYQYLLYNNPLASTVFTFAVTSVHIYVMLMIRSEVKKLRNQSVEIHFVNNAAEGEAACVYASA